jgi:gliding motility-associated-like protein
VNEKPKPESGIRAGICTGDTLVLSPGFYSTYLWQDGSTLDHFVVRNTGVYSVTVSNSCGSASMDYVVANGNCNTFFPTAFTPNNDRKNDFFKVLTDLRFQEFQLVIYNRWGQKIFETKDAAKGWDGYFNNKEQPPGAYVWQCVFRRENTTSQLKGTVMLIR